MGPGAGEVNAALVDRHLPLAAYDCLATLRRNCGTRVLCKLLTSILRTPRLESSRRETCCLRATGNEVFSSWGARAHGSCRPSSGLTRTSALVGWGEERLELRGECG